MFGGGNGSGEDKEVPDEGMKSTVEDTFIDMVKGERRSKAMTRGVTSSANETMR